MIFIVPVVYHYCEGACDSENNIKEYVSMRIVHVYVCAAREVMKIIMLSVDL